MTEVPEHLLRRSKERRAALGLGPEPSDADAAPAGGEAAPAGDAAPAAAPAEVAPAKAPVPVPAEPDPPPPPPAPYVVAAERRKRIPMWALPVLLALPLWGLIYATTLEPQTDAASDPVTAGAAIYSTRCASCHGANGGGGVGPQLSDGMVLETFADPADQAEWVSLGSEGFLEEGTYGDTAKPVNGGMPAFGGTLTPEELVAVVAHERVTLGGEEYDPLVYEELLATLGAE